MDAVIESYKPRTRVHAPAPMPWAAPMPASPSRATAASDTCLTTPDRIVQPGSRVVVVAPHPDDEILAIGATLAALSQRGHAILVVAVTDGEGSHPGSAHWTSDALRSIRPRETEAALRQLGVVADIVRLGLPDGGVARHEKELAQLLPLGSTDTVFVPWRHDGHADHEACARAALAACRTVGARCIEFPVWALVPSHPAHARLAGRVMQRIDVAPEFVQAKCHAMAAFASQVHPDGATPPVLTVQALDTWKEDGEWLFA